MKKTYIIVFLVIVVGADLLNYFFKYYIKKKLKTYFNNQEFSEYQNFLEKMICKIYLRPFDREMQKLIGYTSSLDDANSEKQIEYMFNLHSTLKQKEELAHRAFYFYLKIEDFVKCKQMLDIIEKSENKPDDFNSMKLVYDIFGANKTGYIDTLKNYIVSLEKSKDSNKEAINRNIGIYEFMIALQYKNLNDRKNATLYLNKAKDKCLGTQYEEKINNLLKTL